MKGHAVAVLGAVIANSPHRLRSMAGLALVLDHQFLLQELESALSTAQLATAITPPERTQIPWARDHDPCSGLA